MTRTLACLICLTLANLSGCGLGDREFVSTGEGDDRDLPTGQLADGAMPDQDPDQATDEGGGGNSSADMDASTIDPDQLTMVGDASLLLPDGAMVQPDGAILLPDGEVIDLDTAIIRYEPEIDVTSCEIGEIDTWEDSVEFGDEGGFALVPGLTEGFGLAYRASTEGSCTQNIHVANLPSTGAFPTPTPILDDCKALLDVTVLPSSDGWYLAWVDNATLTAELHTTHLSESLEPDDPVRTTITESQPELEEKPVLAEIAGRPLLVWIAHNTGDDRYGIMGRYLDDPEAATYPIVPMGMAIAPQALAVSQVADGFAAAVAWVGPLDDAGVWLQPLTENGQSRGEPIKLTERVGAASSVSIANRADGGGIVYSIVIDGIPQVRYFRLDQSGDPVADERVLISSPRQAQDASIAALGTGFAVAYRELPSIERESPEIRLVFITREGNTARDMAGRLVSFPVAPATVSTGRTNIAVSIDGQVMVGWIDGNPGTAGNLLKVVRRRLDCATQ